MPPFFPPSFLAHGGGGLVYDSTRLVRHGFRPARPPTSRSSHTQLHVRTLAPSRLSRDWSRPGLGRYIKAGNGGQDGAGQDQTCATCHSRASHGAVPGVCRRRVRASRLDHGCADAGYHPADRAPPDNHEPSDDDHPSDDGTHPYDHDGSRPTRLGHDCPNVTSPGAVQPSLQPSQGRRGSRSDDHSPRRSSGPGAAISR